MLPLLVNTGFQVLFHSPPGVLFTFPSRYYALSVTISYLGLEGGPPGFPQDFTCPVVLWIQLAASPFRIRAFHPLWMAFPYHSAKALQCRLLSATPEVLLPLVWPMPRSLATTSGISVDFFSSPYLDVSVQAVPFLHLWIQYRIPSRYTGWVSPFGHPRIKACLRLPVAYRSLLRPSSASGAKAFPLCSL